MNKRFIVDEDECVAGKGMAYTEYSVRDNTTGRVISLCWDENVAYVIASALEKRDVALKAKAAAMEGTIQA